VDVKPWRIEVEIEEVVLQGFGSLGRDAVGVALETELTRLIAEKGLPARGFEAAVRDGGLLPSGGGELSLGRGLARATYDALQGRTP
jgi:hypothetical protein